MKQEELRGRQSGQKKTVQVSRNRLLLMLVPSFCGGLQVARFCRASKERPISKVKSKIPLMMFSPSKPEPAFPFLMVAIGIVS